LLRNEEVDSFGCGREFTP